MALRSPRRDRDEHAPRRLCATSRTKSKTTTACAWTSSSWETVELDERLGALVAAGREAAINAARWSGAPLVSIYSEVDAEVVSLFVRDQGSGFDPDGVPADRQGIALSIRQRITQRGGSVTIKSTPGQGTDVQITMPRSA